MQDQLTRAVVAVHEFIGGGRTLRDALAELASLTARALDIDMAGLTLNDTYGRMTTAAYTTGVVAEIDQAQYDADRGPCLHAFRERIVVSVPKTADDDRWPEYRDVAVRHGVQSSLSIPVVVAEHGIGAMNLYAPRPAHFDEGSAELGSIFAGHAAIVAAYYDRSEEADNLEKALESRATIEQAKGVIMGALGCTPDSAFDVLRKQSQAENRKLRDIAAEIVDRQQRR